MKCPVISHPRALGAEMALALGFFYYFWAYLGPGGPSTVVTAVAGAVAGTVALAVTLFDAGGGRAVWQQTLIECSKGAGAGATVIFATLLTADLPDTGRWIGVMFAGLAAVIVLVAENGKRLERAHPREADGKRVRVR